MLGMHGTRSANYAMDEADLIVADEASMITDAARAKWATVRLALPCDLVAMLQTSPKSCRLPV